MKIGMIGTNFVSDMFMKAAGFVNEAKVVAVCSGKYENALKFKEKYDIPYAYKNYEEMLEDRKIEAVYIATPNATHYEIAKYCLNKGFPVFCEKPFMLNEKQAFDIFETADKNNVFVHDAIVPLYTENLQILKNHLKDVGKIRKVVLSFQKYSSRYDAYLRGDNPTTFRRELGNGSMMDLGIYVASVAIALFGKPLGVNASSFNLPTGVDALGTIILKYSDMEVVLMHSKITNSNIVSEICGEDGIIQIERPSLMEGIYLFKNGDRIQLSNDEESSFAYQIRDFIKNVKENNRESSLVTRKLSLTILQTIHEARKQCGVIFDGD